MYKCTIKILYNRYEKILRKRMYFRVDQKKKEEEEERKRCLERQSFIIVLY